MHASIAEGPGIEIPAFNHTHAVPKVPNAHRNCTGGPTQAWSPNLGRDTCLTRHISRPSLTRLWTPKPGKRPPAHERRQRPRSTPKPRRPSSTQRARGPSYQSKGLQSTVKPIPRTTPGSATTTGWRGCSNTGPDPICQLDGTLAQQATQHYRVLSTAPSRALTKSVQRKTPTDSHASHFVS